MVRSRLLYAIVSLWSGLGAADPLSLTVVCSDLIPEGGTVHVALWRDPAGWPDRPPAGATTASLPAPSGTTLTVRFPAQPPGPVAVSVYQDRNGNGRIDLGMFGPEEPWGTSRNRTHIMRGPDYAESLIELGPATGTITIVLHH